MNSLIEGTRSKLNLTKSAIEMNLDIPIPNSIYKYYGQSIDSIKSDFDSMKKPVIVRGSTKFDYFADIDVAPTTPNIYTFQGLENAIRNAENFMESLNVKLHREDYGLINTSEINFLIQEQIDAKYVGNMIRNPHTGDIHIEFVDVDKMMSGHNYVKMCVEYCDFDKYLNNYAVRGLIDDGSIMQLVSVFEKIEKSGLLLDNYTHQMEFSLLPLFSFQTRLFKKIEPVANFKIPHAHNYPISMSGTCSFGITPAEGIELPIQEVYNLQWNHPRINFDSPHGMILRSKLQKTPGLDISFRNLTFFGSPCEMTDYLFHGNYRPMQRADLVMINPMVRNYANPDADNRVIISQESYLRSIPCSIEVFKKSKVFADGKDMIIIPTKYL
ncbi:MAG: hypothetical protein WC758_00935 [Candidatus Woesearchaeota archaeon]|jgi:hypothetical protein